LVVLELKKQTLPLRVNIILLLTLFPPTAVVGAAGLHCR